MKLFFLLLLLAFPLAIFLLFLTLSFFANGYYSVPALLVPLLRDYGQPLVQITFNTESNPSSRVFAFFHCGKHQNENDLILPPLPLIIPSLYMGLLLQVSLFPLCTLCWGIIARLLVLWIFRSQSDAVFLYLGASAQRFVSVQKAFLPDSLFFMIPLYLVDTMVSVHENR